ncbi:MAG: hypothetical protein KDA24_28670 [Deltaproteobacteria bacterium]|nr:hypothetical protein [Deltaproteobacteria bacterium]
MINRYHHRQPPQDRLIRMATLALFLAANGGCTPFPSLPSDGSPGTYSVSFDHAGVRREAIVYAPEAVAGGGAAPMLLNFHGYGSTAADHMERADMRLLAEQEGFLLVYPQGTRLQGETHWNSAAPSDDNKSSADDFGFVAELIDTLGAAYELDADRVYAAGYSNGGMMSFGLACYLGDRIAAVAAVSGAMLDDIGVECTPPHATSVITLHGTADSVLPYEGAEGMRSALGVVEFWTELNEITEEPTTTSTTDGGTEVESFVHTGGLGGTEVHHHRVVGGDHVWFEIEIDGADTNRLIWETVSRFGLDGAL